MHTHTLSTLAASAVLWAGAFSAEAQDGWEAPETAASWTNPFEATADSVRTGSEAFKAICASGHGETGRGDGFAASLLKRRPKDLAEVLQRQSDGEQPMLRTHPWASFPEGSWVDVHTYHRMVTGQVADPMVWESDSRMTVGEIGSQTVIIKHENTARGISEQASVSVPAVDTLPGVRALGQWPHDIFPFGPERDSGVTPEDKQPTPRKVKSQILREEEVYVDGKPRAAKVIRKQWETSVGGEVERHVMTAWVVEEIELPVRWTLMVNGATRSESELVSLADAVKVREVTIPCVVTLTKKNLTEGVIVKRRWSSAEVPGFLVKMESRMETETFSLEVNEWVTGFQASGAAQPLRNDNPADQVPWAAPALDRVVVAREGWTGNTLSFDELLDILATADAVFLGELHTDETSHRVELAMYEGLLARRSGGVVLALEMFERDVQPALDSYLAGESSEQQFLAAARPWTNYDTAYRPLIELAKERGLPVVASNFPAPLRRRIAMGGASILDDLEGEAREQAPRELFPNTPAYWRRVDNAVRGHLGMMGASRGDDDLRLYSAQSLWDNSMGEACALALDEHPGGLVLHVNGGFHSAYWDGTVHQFRLRKPDAKILTVSVMPSSNPTAVEPRGKAAADYLVSVEARATDLNEGTYSVYVQREIKYRLHLPQEVEQGAMLPLLIWFSDDGSNAEDGIALWRGRLGDECAIAVVEAPYRETQDDLVEGGRWFWPDSFSSDLGALESATEKIWAYLLRHYPIDPKRVCVAGEGTGATVASAVSLLSSRLSARAIAFSPRRYAKLKDIPLPLPEFRGDEATPEKSLHLILGPNDESWWAGELTEYTSIGFDNAMTVETQDPWLLEVEREAALRIALGLEVTSPPVADAPRRHILAESLRARLWARLMAIDKQRKDGVLVAVLVEPPAGSDSARIGTEVHPEAFADGDGIPRCPGPFGGTTVVVLPDSITPQKAESWLALEKDDPLAKGSRFHRVRIARPGGDRNLSHVLSKLLAENRKNVLVVPAAFCANAATMRDLRRSVRNLEDQLTLHWLPGLGRAVVGSLAE